MSPTSRTLKHLKELGYLCAIVERWQATKTGGVRVDLFGFADILAINESETIAVQTTSYSGHSARRKKILGLYTASQWVKAPGRKILIISWKKTPKRYEIRTEEILDEDFRKYKNQH